ncbi:3-oxo-tetronate kinase [Atlantibacter sp.]|uniref:3-oxo-tetronate kinase n=1 Tax=Atlantibacter sp. TaxID=1903473 RepID=UPI0028A7E819|nr:3-oxo-tetronate kinase [Atlantibacter sp.]
MALLTGVIADDFTGATDIAGFMAQQGLQVALLPGVPAPDARWQDDADVIVISLKSRSLPADEAIRQTLCCAQWLKEVAGARQIYFKYCSTFDSTPAGNIGPVSDALIEQTQCRAIIHSPALPQNGRTLVHGHLFVNGVLLNQSGMENHPINPMWDARLVELLRPQTHGKAAVINLATVRAGVDAVRERFQALEAEGFRHIVVDALTEQDLAVQASAFGDLPLLAGGSGLGGALAARAAIQAKTAEHFAFPQHKKAVVLSGSCSAMTNRQVNAYKAKAPALALDIENCLSDDAQYIDSLADWVDAHSDSALAPLVYATQPPDQLKATQQRFGERAASAAVEHTFAQLAARLLERGFNTFIVAGGETSGTTVDALKVKRLKVGRPIVPGVPWVQETARQLSLALKSGNFGDEDFFFRAQEYQA